MKKQIVSCVWEHNGTDTLLYVQDYPGAYSRGASLEEAKMKLSQEVSAYCRWSGSLSAAVIETDIVCDIPSSLNIADADSDVLFPTESEPLTEEDYRKLKALALRSAEDFHRLYMAVPDKTYPISPQRKTFYGYLPCTAEEMYQHTKNVNSYYFGEIGVDADNWGTILECRVRGFQALEETQNYLQSKEVYGSYGEAWSVRKVLRRFIWHDRIHAKALYRRSIVAFGFGNVPDIFSFEQKKQE